MVPTAFGLRPTAYCLLPTAYWLLPPAYSNKRSATTGTSSPLYGARPSSATSVNGLPKALNEVKIEQKLNEQLPLDLTFRNEQGEIVLLGDYFGKKPVVLALVYYQCPMLCNQVLNGMVTSFKVLNFKAGEEFDVVTVSFDPLETPDLARAKRKLMSIIFRRRSAQGRLKVGTFLPAIRKVSSD